MEQAGAGHCISEDSQWFQDKAGERKIKEDGPVSRLKSTGPRGRSSFGDNGRTRELPVSFDLLCIVVDLLYNNSTTIHNKLTTIRNKSNKLSLSFNANRD